MTPRGSTADPRHVFVFRTGSLGDSLLALPALGALRRRFPTAAFHLITNAPASGRVASWDVLRYTELFSSVLTYSEGLGAAVGLARRIRRHRGTKVLGYLAPHRTPRQLSRDRAFFRYGCGFDEILGLPAQAEPWLPRDADGSLLPVRPEWRRLADGADPASGWDLITDGAESLAVPWVIPDSAAAEAEEALGALARRSPLIAIGPGSQMPAKCWPVERFRELARHFLETDEGAAVVVVGGPEDVEDGDAILEGYPEQHGRNLAGLSVISTAAVLRHCSVFAGNDSGNMHLAAIMGVPCVVLSTSRDSPGRWDPPGPRHVVLRRDYDCAGCLLEVCRVEKQRCLTAIEVGQACAAVSRLLR